MKIMYRMVYSVVHFLYLFLVTPYKIKHLDSRRDKLYAELTLILFLFTYVCLSTSVSSLQVFIFDIVYLMCVCYMPRPSHHLDLII
jgi:hypothetical protein